MSKNSFFINSKLIPLYFYTGISFVFSFLLLLHPINIPIVYGTMIILSYIFTLIYNFNAYLISKIHQKFNFLKSLIGSIFLSLSAIVLCDFIFPEFQIERVACKILINRLMEIDFSVMKCFFQQIGYLLYINAIIYVAQAISYMLIMQIRKFSFK